jgi:hypothetical protein
VVSVLKKLFLRNNTTVSDDQPSKEFWPMIIERATSEWTINEVEINKLLKNFDPESNMFDQVHPS